MTRYATVLEVASDSSNATYKVYVGEDEVPVFCTCPGFRLRQGHVENRKPCKHMRRLGANDLRAAATVARTVGTQGRRSPVEVAAVTTQSGSRFRFIEVVAESNDGQWTPVDGARFTNLEVN